VVQKKSGLSESNGGHSHPALSQGFCGQGVKLVQKLTVDLSANVWNLINQPTSDGSKVSAKTFSQ
jgi:hypothetical protein